MFHRIVRVSCVAAFVWASIDSVEAQSVWGVAGPTTLASNTAGPPGCDVCPIAGPLLSESNYTLPTGGPCLPVGAFAGPSFLPIGLGFDFGDITVNRVDDTVWITDGFNVTGYAKSWATIDRFPNPLPFPLTGLGYQAPNILWLTDGFHAMAVTPSGVCGAAAIVVVPSFPIAAPPVGIATDIDYDPCTNMLYLSHQSGFILSFFTTGMPGKVYKLSLSTGCTLLPFHSGLAVDTATPGTIFLTDGLTVTRVIEDTSANPPAFVTAAPTNYAPCCAWNWAGTGGPTSGLAFDATPIATCPGCDPSGGVPPVFRATHEAISPNPNFGVEVTGAPPTTVGILIVGPCLCPGVPIGCGCTICTMPNLVIALFTTAQGTVSFPAPLPGGFACLGIGVCAQFVFLDPSSGCPITSNAINISIAAP